MFPDKHMIAVPVLPGIFFSLSPFTPIFENQLLPLEIISGTYVNVLTLLILLGLPQTPN